MINYSEVVLNLIAEPKYVYNSDQNIFIYVGHAGDLGIGEYIFLYLQTSTNQNTNNTQIIKARWSAIGGVALISLAEKFCSTIETKIINEVLELCDFNKGFAAELKIPQERVHSFNFVVHAFYMIVEAIVNNPNISSS